MSAPELDTAAAAAQDVAVDESPISPARANPELEKRLAARPDAQDLKNRHILLDTNAAPCVPVPLPEARCLTIVRAMVGRCSQSSSSSSARRSPTASRRGSSTGRSARSSSSVLISLFLAPRQRGWQTPGNILPDSTAAPALQAHQRELEKHMRRDSLEKQLQTRPKPADLVREGILEGGLMSRSLAGLTAAAEEDPTKQWIECRWKL
jgi:RPEL repeat